MAYEWLESYCLGKPGVEKVFKEEWNAILYRVGGKMFLMDGGDKMGAPIITVKLAPAHGELARQEYEGVVPGYYMNKAWWNSIYRDSGVPDDVVKAYVDESYAMIFDGLTKKARQEIAGAAQ